MESPSRLPFSSVAAVQAALPALEARHVNSQEVAKPVLQHAMVPKKPTAQQVPSSSFQRYNVSHGVHADVGPLAAGRCEALTLLKAAIPPPPPAYDQIQHLNMSNSSHNLQCANEHYSADNEQQFTGNEFEVCCFFLYLPDELSSCRL